MSKTTSLRFNQKSNKVIPRDISESLGKLPPQAIDLEEAVLGAMILQRNGLIQVVDLIKPEDFYLDAHQIIYQAIVDLFRADQPVDMRTVVVKLTTGGQLEIVGGKYRIAELTAKVNSSANIEYHARIIIEHSLKRKLITLASTIHHDAYEDDTDVFELLDQAQQQFDVVTGQYLSGNVKSNKIIFNQAIQNLLSGKEKKGLTGVPSGYTQLDRLTAGWQKTELTIIAGRPGMGKALTLDSEILTKDEWWVCMRDIKPGMKVAASDGNFYSVSGVYPQGFREVYDVYFDDGTVVRCDEEHLWTVRSRKDRKYNKPERVLPLKQMLQEPVLLRDGRKNYSINYCAPVQYPENPHYIHPYIMGVLLGDGSLTHGARFENPEEDITAKVQSLLPVNYVIHSNGITRNIKRLNLKGLNKRNLMKLELERLGLLNKRSYEKSVPLEYLIDSVENRIHLLHGLMDTDGFVTNNKSPFVEYCTTSKELADGVVELVRSLGGKAVMSEKNGVYKKHDKWVECKMAYRILICFDNRIKPVSSKKHLRKLGEKRFFKKYITAIKKSGIERTQCISVDSPDNTFLTNNYTITHNTAFVVNVLRNAAVDFQIPVAIFSLEMSAIQLEQRMISSESETDIEKIIHAQYEDHDFTRISHTTTRLANAPIFIDDTPALGILELRAKCRRLKAEHKIQLIVVDYLQLMRGDQGGNREQEISSISRALKGIAKDLDVPVLALSQLSRGVETRGGDKRPQLSDLRESGSIEQDADKVIFLYRPEYYKITVYEDGSPTNGVMEVIVAKNRNGRCDTVKVKFIGKYSKVTDFDILDVTSAFPPSTPPAGNFKLFKNSQVSRREHDDPPSLTTNDENTPF